MNKTKRAAFYFVAVVLLAIPVVTWAQATPFTFRWPSILRHVSRLLAVLGFVMLFIQYSLSSRMSFIERGLGLDRLLHLHRRTGIATLVLLVLHGALLTVYELALGFLSFSLGKIIGIAALLAVVLAAGAALVWRSLGWKYETWKRVHYASYVVLPLGFFHALRLGTAMNRSTLLVVYYSVLLAVYVAFLVGRAVRYVRARRNPFTVSEVRRESHDVVSLCFSGPVPSFAPGQFMLVRIRQDSRYSPSHPYTISSAPTDGFLRLSAKGIGDYSTSLAEVSPGTRAIIEAPFGVFSYQNVGDADLVFVAGGIGITPFLSQLRELRATPEPRRVRLIWGNKTREDIAFTDELEAAQRELPDFALVHVLSNESWEGESGFIDEGLLRRYVPDFATPEFFVCGPPAMMTTVIPALRGLGVDADRIHFERFAL